MNPPIQQQIPLSDVLSRDPLGPSIGHTSYSPEAALDSPPTVTLDPPSRGDSSERGPLGLLGVVLFIVVGFIMIGMVLSSGFAGEGPFCLWIVGLLAVIGYVVVRYLFFSEPTPSTPVEPQGQQATREVRIETVRETVKVRCRYCGTLNLETDTKCSSCGANL